MNNCPNCILYRRALIAVAETLGGDPGMTAPLAALVKEAQDRVHDIAEQMEELQAPSWTRHEVIKPRKDEDCYVLWVSSADGPCWVGTRAEALAERIPESRLRRADETGTSAKPEGYGHYWDSPGVVAEQLGFLSRDRAGDYAKLGRKRERLFLLEPFADAPIGTLPACVGMSVETLEPITALPVSAFTDKHGWLRRDQAVWLDDEDGYRRMAIVEAVGEDVVVRPYGEPFKPALPAETPAK